MQNRNLKFEAMVLQGLAHISASINELVAGRTRPTATQIHTREAIIWNNTFGHLAEDSSTSSEAAQLSLPPAFLFQDPGDPIDA